MRFDTSPEHRFHCHECHGFGYLHARGDRRMITYLCPGCTEQPLREFIMNEMEREGLGTSMYPTDVPS